jgi:hypothetical protein
MNTKIVYVLVSDKSDYYVEMLQLSLYSLRLFHPNDIVEVVMDEKTHARLVKQKAHVLTDIKPIVIDIPKEYSLMQQSRYLKTRLREIIDGDFLYLDTDTVIAGPLGEVDGFSGDIAAVWDNHDGEFFIDQSEPKGWARQFPVKRFNAGVLYVKDTPTAHRFFQQWHENWKYCVSEGCSFDQPGFRKAFAESGIPIQQLSGVWNCQVNRATCAPYVTEAKVFHYQRAGFYVSKICREIRKKGTVLGLAAALAENPYQYFCGQTYYMTRMESSSLDSLRKTQYDYPGFFSFLVKLAGLYRSIVTGLSTLKQKIVALIKP